MGSLVRPHYAKAARGRQPVGLSIMLRTYFVPQWFNLSDPGVEELLYESPVVRRFVGVDLGMASAPDETTILRFRHLLERHDLGGLMLEAVNVHLEAKGIKIQTGMIVDATIIHAPSSTNPDMSALLERGGAFSELAKDHATVPFGVLDVLAIFLVGGLGCQRESCQAAVVVGANLCICAEESDEGDFVHYVELGRFCQRDSPRRPWPPSACRHGCNDRLVQHRSSLSLACMAGAASI